MGPFGLVWFGLIHHTAATTMMVTQGFTAETDTASDDRVDRALEHGILWP